MRKKAKCAYCASCNECDDAELPAIESLICLRGEYFVPADNNRPMPVSDKLRGAGQRFYYDMGNNLKPVEQMLRDMQYERDNWN